MIKVKIFLKGDGDITLEYDGDFIYFISQLFKKKIYISIPRESGSNIAINTDNILFVRELK